MAGQIIVSSIKTDSDNSISFLANTGATIFSANLASGLSADSFGNNSITSDKIVSVANTKIAGNIVSSQITSVANTQLTGTVTSAQVGETVYEGMMFRNRIINGDMRIDQRNAGAAVTSFPGYAVDRFGIFENGSMAFSAQRSTTAPAGFVNSLAVTVTTSASPTSANRSQMYQGLEGTNVADLGWGTANAKTVTLSFWVRSSLTGQFGGAIQNTAANRSYPYTYTISAANTWEYKTVTIPGDTTGTWPTDTSFWALFWDLGMGSDLLGPAGAWAAADYRGATGDVKLSENNGATFYITGVQLEVGSVATPFERRPYGAELALCQRYYWQMISGGPDKNIATGTYYSASLFLCSIQFPVSMRTAPSLSLVTGTNYYVIYSNSTADNINSFTINATTDITTNVEAGSGDGASGTAGYGAQMRSNNAASKVGFTAEL